MIRAPIKRPILRRLRTIFADRDWPPSRFDQLWSEFLNHVGLSLVEPLRLERMDDTELKKRIAFIGEEHLHGALRQGRGVMMFINHIGESGAVLALGRFGYDLTFVTDPMPVPFFERGLNRHFASMRTRRLVIGRRTAFDIARAFARNGIVAAYTDISMTPRHGQWLPFGPAELRLHPGPATLAVRHRVPVLYVNTERLPDNHHRVTISAPLPYDPDDSKGSVRSLLEQATQFLHAEVRRRPAQWWALDFVDVRPRVPWRSGELASLARRTTTLPEAVPAGK
jgi:lauroyl/myristoyl acyltransferase